MRAEVIRGDALVEMPRLIERGVGADLLLTDPPYGVREEEWDDKTRFELAHFSMSWMSTARRLSDRLLTFFCEKNLKTVYDLAVMLYPRVRLMVWDKPLGSEYAGSAEDGIWFAQENILYCHQAVGACKPKTLEVAEIIRAAREAKGLSRGGVDMVLRGKKTGLCYRWEEAACLPTPEQAEQLRALLGLNGDFTRALEKAYGNKADGVGAVARDVFTYRTVTAGHHPCEKPLGLMRELIRLLTRPGDLVIDPFMGSGTTGVACVIEGRDFIGIEKDPDYCRIGEARMQRARGIPADIPRLSRKHIATPLFNSTEAPA